MHIQTAKYALYNLKRKRSDSYEFHNAYFTWLTARKFRMAKRFGVAQLRDGKPFVVFRLKSWKQ